MDEELLDARGRGKGEVPPDVLPTDAATGVPLDPAFSPTGILKLKSNLGLVSVSQYEPSGSLQYEPGGSLQYEPGGSLQY